MLQNLRLHDAHTFMCHQDPNGIYHVTYRNAEKRLVRWPRNYSQQRVNTCNNQLLIATSNVMEQSLISRSSDAPSQVYKKPLMALTLTIIPSSQTSKAKF